MSNSVLNAYMHMPLWSLKLPHDMNVLLASLEDEETYLTGLQKLSRQLNQ